MNRLTAFPRFFATWLATHWQWLLLLGLGLYLPLQVFAVLALQTWQLEGGLAWELPLMQTIHQAATPGFDQAAALLTKLGSAKRVLPVAVAVGLWLLWQKRWRTLTFWTLTLVGCAVINWSAKGFWHRVRPQLWYNNPLLQDFSFPSGHAMTSMALASALIVLTWGSRWFWLTVVLGSVYVVTIGWTRLYLGVHYPSDVLAGWMLSLAWAIGMSALIKPQGFAAASTAAETQPDDALAADTQPTAKQTSNR